MEMDMCARPTQSSHGVTLFFNQMIASHLLDSKRQQVVSERLLGVAVVNMHNMSARSFDSLILR